MKSLRLHDLKRRRMRDRISGVAKKNPGLADALENNIETIIRLRHEVLANRTLQERISDAITDFSGSMAFLYLHMAWFAIWIAVNLGWVHGVKPFDPFPFGFLTMVVSLEAIFLSTFVLISQNRMQAVSDDREDLDLQVDLLAEYEITRILTIVTQIGKKLEVEGCFDSEIEQLEQVVKPAEVLKEITDRKNMANG